MAHSAWKWMVVAVTVVGVGVAACSDDDEPGPGPSDGGFDAGVNKERPGFGEDPGTIIGTAFTFPSGVELAGPIYGADEVTGECDNGVSPLGTGQAVRICVPLRNLSGAPVLVTFPPGLTMIHVGDSRIQNGMLIGRIRVNVPPTGGGPGGIDAGTDGGVDPNAFVVPLHLYCLNEQRGPSELNAPYALGPVSTDEDIQELLRLLEGKVIDDQDAIDVVQHALYSITEGNGLTKEDRDAIDDL
ncbi:hypothetical protein LZ198_06735 [Myxococcus sp. K15C18031901]|uniref:hypothetical protein n=1 Tax=Myxococcus dinghuensis TaxID=2906761 RepID=UPI0020A7A604|nr:hypothetical protein [Myxococcus dinghuensis]MCP3098569.1 hypothetical protein [Myxococcus dinghuensis]